MGENEYFQKALANFTHEAAGGGAIRHLAGAGYTVKQIAEQLDFPVPYEKIQKTVWEHLVGTGVILLEEPGSGRQREKAVYVRDYDKYGKCSFRKVVQEEKSGKVLHWRELSPGGDVSLEQIVSLLQSKREENGETNSYASCDFGNLLRKEPERYRKMLLCLDERQKEYIGGLPWERREVYHRLDFRMMEILERLCRAGQYQGTCYFPDTGDKINVAGRY